MYIYIYIYIHIHIHIHLYLVGRCVFGYSSIYEFLIGDTESYWHQQTALCRVNPQDGSEDIPVFPWKITDWAMASSSQTGHVIPRECIP